MPDAFSFGNLEFQFGPRASSAQRRPEPETPFRIAVLADLSGRASRALVQAGPMLAARKPTAIDIDNLDAAMAAMHIQVQVPIGASAVAIPIASLDDLHPDQIFDSVDLFQALRSLRSRLLSPASFAAAAAEVRSWSPAVPAAPAPAALTPTQVASTQGGEGAFAALLGKPAARAAAGGAPRSGVDLTTLLKQAVGPYIVPAADPKQAELVATVDRAISGQMRAILHHPNFQSVESAWRAVHLLITTLETTDELSVSVIDASKDELAADLAGASDLRASGLYKLLVDATIGSPGAKPWAVLVGNFTFDRTVADAELLGRIAKIARAAGAPFFAAATPRHVGCTSFDLTPDPDHWTLPADPALPRADQAWTTLRKLPEASSIALALPRFLLRIPYGKATEPIDRFEFEEIDAAAPAATHESYLWANPAFACAYLLGDAFASDGWQFTPGGGGDLAGLPVHSWKERGEAKSKPCAEAWLTDRAADRIQDRGLIPVLSIRGRDAVRIAGLRSLAEPAAPIAGRWS